MRNLLTRRVVTIGALILCCVIVLPCGASGQPPQGGNILLYTTRDYGTGLGVRRWDYDEDLPAILAPDGFSVTVQDRETQPTFNAAILAGYDQLWFVSTESGALLSTDEVHAIHDFHSTGKGIMIIGDSYTYDGPANQIGAGWGVQILDQIDYCGGPVGCPISTAGFPSHEIWNGVNSIQANLNEGRLQVSAPATAIAVYNTINMVAVLDDGIGRVAWDGTYYRFTDVSCHPDISIADANNAQYVRNLANWLAGSGQPPEDITGPASAFVSLGVDDVTGCLSMKATFDDRLSGNSKVVKAEYFWDNPVQQVGTGVNIPLPDDRTPFIESDPFDFCVLGLSEGSHTLYVRAMDELGNWGATTSIGFKLQDNGFSVVGNGFCFSNTPIWTVYNLPWFGTVGISGWCAGMVYAAICYKQRGIPVPADCSFPPVGSGLYLYIVKKHIGAFSNFFDFSSLSTQQSSDEIKALFAFVKQSCIDASRYVPLGLYTPGIPGLNHFGGHMVLPYMTLEMEDTAYIYIYDPNYPNDLRRVIKFPHEADLWKMQPYTSQGTEYSLIHNLNELSLNTCMGREFIARLKCPMDLFATSPGGVSIGPAISREEGGFYLEELQSNGDTAKMAVYPLPEEGYYTLTAVPRPDALSSDLYSLTVYLDTDSIVLADEQEVGELSPRIFNVNTLPFASVSGFATADSAQGLLGVNVDIYDSAGALWQTVVTDDSGYYHIDSIPNGSYTASVVTPLGYQADQETKQFTIHHVPVTVDFHLTKLQIPMAQRGRGYWMHQVNALLSGNSNPQETYDDMCDYMELIRTHFNEHQLNPVNIFSIDLESDCDERMEALRTVISPKPKSSMNDKAKVHLTTLLLNMVSGKIALWEYISEDSATVSQAITYCNALIIDTEPENDEMAKDIAEMINEGQTVPAGMIDLATANIAYKQSGDESLPTEFSLGQNYPNPFNPATEISFSLPSASHVKLEIFNVMGQKVATLVDGQVEAGEHIVKWDGSKAASGVYLYRLQADDFVDTKKMILLK